MSRGDVVSAIDFLDVAQSSDNEGLLSSFLTPETVRRLLMLSSYGGSVGVADRLIALCMKDPGRRLDASVVELYASMLASGSGTSPSSSPLASSPPSPVFQSSALSVTASNAASVLSSELPRGFAFCLLTSELGFDAFSTYLSSLQRCYGDASLRAAADFAASDAENMGFDALLSIMRSLRQLQSSAIGAIFPHALRAASLPTPSPARLQRVHDIYIDALVAMRQLPQASRILFRSCAEHGLQPSTYSVYLLARSLCSSLGEKVASMARRKRRRLAIQSTTTLASSASPEEGEGKSGVVARGGGDSVSAAVKAAPVQPLNRSRFAVDDASSLAEDTATMKLVDILVECLRRLVLAESLRPHLFANAGIILRSAGRLDDNVEILSKMLSSEVLRENVITERHVDALLADLLRARKLREARDIFWSLISDPSTTSSSSSTSSPSSLSSRSRSSAQGNLSRSSPVPSAPSTKTFNMMLFDAARRSDSADARELIKKMGDLRISADRDTFSAIALLRSNVKAARREEEEVSRVEDAEEMEGGEDANSTVSLASSTHTSSRVDAHDTAPAPSPLSMGSQQRQRRRLSKEDEERDLEELELAAKQAMKEAEAQKQFRDMTSEEAFSPVASSPSASWSAPGRGLSDVGGGGKFMQHAQGAVGASSGGGLGGPSGPPHALQQPRHQHQKPTATAASYNQFMQGYFRVGAPQRALGVLEDLLDQYEKQQHGYGGGGRVGAHFPSSSFSSSFGVRNGGGDAPSSAPAPKGDTLRTLLLGCVYAGGEDVTGIPAASIPSAWGGAMPNEEYQRRRAWGTGLRVKINAAASAGSGGPSTVVPASSASQLRFGGAGKVLTDIHRILQSLSASPPSSHFPPTSSSSSSTSINSMRSAVQTRVNAVDIDDGLFHQTATNLGVPWWRKESGTNLVKAWLRFKSKLPWSTAPPSSPTSMSAASHNPSSSTAAASFLAGEGGGGGGGQSHPTKGEASFDLYNADTFDLLTPKGSGGSVADGSSSPPASAIHEDLLTRLPSLMPRLRKPGGALDHLEVQASADNVISWAALFLPPHRALHLFLELHEASVWGTGESAGPHSSHLLVPSLRGFSGGRGSSSSSDAGHPPSLSFSKPVGGLVKDLMSIDVRRVQPATASLYLHLCLSHIATRRERPPPGVDLLILTGPRGGRTHGHAMELLLGDIEPPLRPMASERGLFLSADALGKWYDSKSSSHSSLRSPGKRQGAASK